MNGMGKGSGFYQLQLQFQLWCKSRNKTTSLILSSVHLFFISSGVLSRLFLCFLISGIPAKKKSQLTNGKLSASEMLFVLPESQVPSFSLLVLPQSSQTR